MAEEHYLEDFSVGQTFRSGSITIEAEQIKLFAVAVRSRNRFIWTNGPPRRPFSAGWSPAAGTRPL